MVKIFADGAEFDISKAVRQDICKLLASDENEKNVVFIVPDQFEFETEKAVYKDLLERDLLTRHNEIHIETFSSLSEKILANAGEKRIPADETIKNILMHKAVRDQKSALSALSRQAEKSGFCQKMLTTISMLNAAGLSASKLDESSIRKNLDQNESLKNHLPFVEKLCDVSKIQASYEGFMSRYIDRVDAIGEAADFIASEKNKLFENADIFVDCFNDFTGNQLCFLMKLTEKAKNITFGFTVDLSQNSRENLFYGLRNQIDQIIGYARENAAEIVIRENDIPRRIPENSPLSELSRKIFGSEKSSVSLGEACELVHSADVYDEIDYTAAKIKELCLDKGYLYREIAVLCADSSYWKLIKRGFDKYEIPYFIDIPEPILYQPLVNFFLALINVLRDFSVDSVLSLIKTNFMSKPKNLDEISGENEKKSALSNKDIDDFETYIFEWNLQAKHLKKPFNYADSSSSTQANAEAVRAAVVEPVLRLKNELKNKDGAEITRLIYEFAESEIGIERVLYGRCLKPNSSEIDTELLRLNQQLWNTLAVILETLERELKGEYLSLDEYFRIFSDICSGTSLAKPPQFQDSVIVGDIDRTRANGIKAAFIIGASYEKFPTVNEGTGIFSENETEFLRENISEFGIANSNSFALKSTKEQYCLSLYRAYRAVSLATERLTIISRDYDLKGANVQKSLVVSEIQNLFPNTRVIETAKLDDKFYCRSLKAAKQRYASKFAKNSQDNAALRDALTILNCEDFVDKLDEIRQNKTRKNLANPDKIGQHRLQSKTAKRLFDVNVGATSVEKLNLCKFNYFCEYGLKIRERKQRVFNILNRGNAVHYVLQNVLEAYCEKMDEFFKLTRKDFTALARLYLDEYLKNETNGDFEEDFRTKFLFSNLAISAVDVLITLQAEFAARDYRPKFFELDLSEPAQMSIIDSNDNEQIVLPETELFSENSAADFPKNTASSSSSTNKVIIVQPLKITLDDGSTVSISGRVDRVDMFFTQNNESYVRIVDYKSSAKNFDAEKAKKGVNIQMLLYLFALCDANRNNSLKVNPGGICYIPSANSGAVEDKMSAFRLLAMNHHQSGLYVKDKFTDEENQKYFDFLINKIFSDEASNNNPLDEKTKEAIKKAFIPDEENSPDFEKFEELRSECLALLKENFEQLLDGNIDALPIKYSENKIKLDGQKGASKTKMPCDYCRFRLICGNNEERVIELSNSEKGAKK